MRPSLITGVLFTALSAASGLLGLRELQIFDNTAGANSRAGMSWPEHVPFPAPSGRPLLLLFAHPSCGCTNATVSELRQVLEEASPSPDVRIFFEPEGTAKAVLWSEAAALPRSTVAWDTGGQIALRFGARTSGVLKLYDATGNLRFEGGITSARGHEGRSPGGDALLAALRGEHAGMSHFPVFGCALQAERS